MRRCLLLACLLIACDSPSAGDGGAFDVQGNWRYEATQTLPALDIEGALQITEQNGGNFTGTVAFTETDVQGTQHSRTGAINGRFVGNTVVDIDVHVDAQVRRHVARMSADSMNGTWNVTGTASLTGSFTARRLP
jgi:hypothetical protein